VWCWHYPQLAMAMVISLFQQLIGMNVIMF
jgi:hypothetical protein